MSSIIFNLLPRDPLISVFSFFSSNEQLQFSEINQKIKSVLDSCRTSLSINFPKEDALLDSNSECARSATYMLRAFRYDQDILVRLLQRFSNITQLSFNNVSSRAICTLDERLLTPFFESLLINYPKNLKHLEVREIEGFPQFGSVEINNKLIQAVTQVNTVSLEYLATGPNIGGVMPGSLIKKCEDLTVFACHLQFEDNPFARIDFQSHLNLRKVSLYKLSSLGLQTLKELAALPNLLELGMYNRGNCEENSAEFSRFCLSVERPLKLRVLDLKNFTINDDAMSALTNYLPDLKCFYNPVYYEVAPGHTDRGLIELAKNCKRLEAVILNLDNITDEGLSMFAANAQALKRFSGRELKHVTRLGLEKLTQFCPDLEALSFWLAPLLDLPTASPLLQNCKQLQFLELTFRIDNLYNFDDVKDLLANLGRLKYFNVGLTRKTQLENIKVHCLMDHEFFSRFHKNRLN